MLSERILNYVEIIIFTWCKSKPALAADANSSSLPSADAIWLAAALVPTVCLASRLAVPVICYLFYTVHFLASLQ